MNKFALTRMTTRIVLICLMVALTSGVSQAQKQSSKTFTITYEIESTEKGPDGMTYFHSDMRVKDVVDDREIKMLSQKYLVVPGPFMYRVASDKLGTEDWSVWLEVDAINILSVTDKPEESLKPDDELFRYNASARVVVKVRAGGKVLFEKALADVGEERTISKADLHRLREISYAAKDDKKKAVFYSLVERARDALQYAYGGERETIYVSIFSVKGKAYSEVQDAQEKVFDAYYKFHALSKKNRIPKADVDAVFRSVIPVWEKYAADATLEEKAKKGMLLNCAVAYTWLGEFDKAKTYLDQVPETATSDAMDGKPAFDPASVPLGSTIFLNFDQAAEGARLLFTSFKKVFPIMKINQ